MRFDFFEIGDIQKKFEQQEAGRTLMPGIPVLARLDGRSFHSFTKGLQRPFDPGMSYSMVETLKSLLEATNADVGYTQSDEITLCWKNLKEHEASMMFSGKYQKLCSVLAAMASVKFSQLIAIHLQAHYLNKLPVFDCRVWQVPNFSVAADNFLWREADAVKNSITMAASHYYSHKQLHGVSGSDKLKMLEEKGVIWGQYPTHFKRGVYVKKVKTLLRLTEEELSFIKPEYRPIGPVERSHVVEMDWPKSTTIGNWEAVLFLGEEPITVQKAKDGNNTTTPGTVDAEQQGTSNLSA